MANYTTNAKGIISRDIIASRKPKLTELDLSLLIGGIFFVIVWVFVYFASLKNFAFIFVGIGVAFTVCYPLLKFVILPSIDISKNKSKYYLELDTVSSSVITEQDRFASKHHEKPRRFCNISFKSRRTYKVEICRADNQFPTMQNRDKIPLHMTTLRELAEGDVCYLLQREGKEKIIEVFYSKYYTLSGTDFEQRGDRYYLNDNIAAE